MTHNRPEIDGGVEEKSGVGAVALVQSGEKVRIERPLLGNRISDHSSIPKHQMPFRTVKRPPVRAHQRTAKGNHHSTPNAPLP